MLLYYGANPLLETYSKKLPLNYSTDPLVIRILEKASIVFRKVKNSKLAYKKQILEEEKNNWKNFVVKE